MKENIFDIKEELGRALQKIRKEKGITQQELSDDYLSRPQVSNIEKAKQSTTFEKIIYFLDKLNVTPEEFIYHIDDDYHAVKDSMLIEISKFASAGDITALNRLKNKSQNIYQEYKVPFFLFLTCLSEARISLIENEGKYDMARKKLAPLKEYLLSLKNYSYNDLTFIGESVYIFDIETSKFLVDKALTTINNHYNFYRHRIIGGAIALNMALYSLDFPEQLQYSLDYSLKAIELSTTSTHLSTTLKAKIAYQIACFKSGNGRYNASIIEECLRVFKLAEWHSQHTQIIQFLKQHHLNF